MKKTLLAIASVILAALFVVTLAFPCFAATPEEEAKAKIVSMLADVPMRPYAATTSYKGYAFASDGVNLYGALYRTKTSGTAFVISLDGGDSQSEKTFLVYASAAGNFNVAWPGESGKIDDYRFGDKDISINTITEGFYAIFDTTANAEYVMIPLSYFGITEAPTKISTYEVESSWAFQHDPFMWTKLNAGDVGYAVKTTAPATTAPTTTAPTTTAPTTTADSSTTASPVTTVAPVTTDATDPGTSPSTGSAVGYIAAAFVVSAALFVVLYKKRENFAN